MSFSENKIYLLYPPVSKKERYSSEIGNAGGEQIPLGIYYLASYVRQKNFEVKVTDGEALKMTSEDILDEIKGFSPKFVGISSTTVAFHRTVEIAKKIRERFHSVTIILGGPHVSANPSHAMEFSEIDFGVMHEGEITIVELLETINRNGNFHNVKGILFRNEDGKVIQTAPREYIENLDILPFPAYDLINDISLYTPPPSNYKTLPVINMITSRGCPYQCTFCDKNIFGNGYRRRSAENIVEEIKYLKKNYSIREIAFVDDTFLVDKKRAFKMFELLEKEKIFFYWTCMSHINNTPYDFLQFIKSKGCWHISFGIESGDENILRVIKKKISLQKAREVISWCRNLKIKTKGFFIIGHPTETLESLDKTIRFACTLNLDDIVATINTPIPGSQQYAEAAQYGTLDQTNWAEYNYWRPVFVPHGLSKEILLKKHKEMYQKFYLRPFIIFRYLMSFLGKGGGKRFIAVFRASFYLFQNKQD